MSDHMKEVRYDEYCKFCSRLDTKDEREKDICDDCLANSVMPDSEKPLHYDGKFVKDYSGAPSPFSYLKKVEPYLYEIQYTSMDKSKASKYFSNTGHSNNCITGGCSSVHNGNWFGRNYDWVYSDLAEFVVHTTAKPYGSRHASIGIAGGLKELTDAAVDSRKKSFYYDILPFQMIDGMNDEGVVCCMNVVPAISPLSNTRPAGRQLARMSAMQVVRYILDNFGSAAHATEFFKDHASIYFPNGMTRMGYEVHYMIADANSTYILEFHNGFNVAIDVTAAPYMTNFHIYGVQPNPDGCVYTPETQTDTYDAVRTNRIHPFGSGLERYNYISNNYSSSNSHRGMRELMNGLKYTKAYRSASDVSNPYWYTEFVGTRGLRCDSPAADYYEVTSIADGYFKNRSRTDGGLTWQTVHSSVYDIQSKKLYLCVQEENKEHEFKL